MLKIKNYVRTFSTIKPSWEEIKIPMPWGHVSAKWWGRQDNRPVLLLHGWQDNCGTFDRLVPRLNPNHGYLAIDLPGHGLSSHLPLGVSYCWTNWVVTVRRIVKHFKWNKMSILGHSVGGATGYFYEMLFPNHLDFLITIDALKPLTNTHPFTSISDRIEKLIKYDKILSLHQEGPTYTMDELKNLLHRSSYQSIHLDACEYILKRNVKESTVTPNKYYFVRDPRVKLLPLLNTKHKQIIENTDKFLCPTLYFVSKQVNSFYAPLTDSREILRVLRKTKKNLEVHDIDGTHHVHLNNPELISEYINEFIEKHYVKN
ncbi:hypothetical protein FQA39_LY01218 [Lamprigera yunnana]|nr:hypothetical protein FQA39_LY01218 [Lamprigera yunnana]